MHLLRGLATSALRVLISLSHRRRESVELCDCTLNHSPPIQPSPSAEKPDRAPKSKARARGAGHRARGWCMQRRHVPVTQASSACVHGRARVINPL